MGSNSGLRTNDDEASFERRAENRLEAVYAQHTLDLSEEAFTRLATELEAKARKLAELDRDILEANARAARYVADQLNRSTISSAFKKTSPDQGQGGLASCYLFAAVDSLAIFNMDLLVRSAQKLGMLPGAGTVKLTNHVPVSFTQYEINRWIGMYHSKKDHIAPPLCYILLEMAEQARRAVETMHPGIFPIVERGETGKVWKQIIPPEHIRSLTEDVPFEGSHPSLASGPRSIVSVSLDKSYSDGTPGRHAYTLLEMKDDKVRLLDPRDGEVTFEKSGFMGKNPRITRLEVSARGTSLGDFCELMSTSGIPLALKRKLFKDLMGKNDLYSLLQLDASNQEALAKDLNELLSSFESLLIEVGIVDEALKVGIQIIRPQSMVQYKEVDVVETQRGSQRKSPGLSCEALALGAILLIGSAIAIRASRTMVEISPAPSAISAVCNQAKNGTWTLVSGQDVFREVPKKMNATVVKGNNVTSTSMLARGNNLPSECFVNRAPGFVLAYDPRGKDHVQLAALTEDGIEISGLYHFTMDGETVAALQEDNTPSTRRLSTKSGVNWLVVEEGTDGSIACRVKNSQVEQLCENDLKVTGLIIQEKIH